jgi:photosystem II stability/assembly factor-like uncharacterized protein
VLATSGARASAAPSHAALAPGRLSAVAFTGPRHGYGLFLRNPGSRCQDQVARTADGGAHFTSLTAVISWPCDHNSPAASLAADSAGDVFLYGPRLLVSHDSGSTWTAPRPPGAAGRNVLAIAAAGRSIWLLAADCSPGRKQPGRCGVRLLESSDGGRSWTPAAVQPPEATVAGGSGDGPGLGQTWLVRTGPRSGYVLTGAAVNPRGMPDHVPLWFTGDGGSSWVRRSAPCGMDAMYAAAAAAPGGALFVVCAGQPATGFQAKSVARSADHGRTWALHAWCPHRPVGCLPLNAGYLGAIAAPSWREVFLVGARSSMMASRDGGAHWSAVHPLIGDGGGSTIGVIFFNRADGLVLGDDPAGNYLPAIWHTTDGGARWRPVHPVVT